MTNFIESYWLTSTLLLFILATGFRWWNTRAQYSDYGVNYLTVFAEAKYYKVLSAPFFHASIWHLLINTFLLVAGLAQVEAQRGATWILPHLLLFAVRGAFGLHICIQTPLTMHRLSHQCSCTSASCTLAPGVFGLGTCMSAHILPTLR